MRGLNRAGRWVLALAVLGTAPLATWGGGCSSSLTSVQPDASGHAGATGAGGAAGTSGEAGTSGTAGCSGADAGCCPACCSGNEPSYCSADGKYMSCFAQSAAVLTVECADRCPPGPIGGYAYVWGLGAAGFSGSCATGGNGAGGQSGSNGGIGGQSGTSGGGGQSGYSGGLCADGSGGAAGGSTGGAPVCCPQCCSQPNVGPHCTDDGHHYLACFMVPTYSFPSGCGNCGSGPYVWVWQAQSCADGCVNPAGGASGGGGGAPGCQ